METYSCCLYYSLLYAVYQLLKADNENCIQKYLVAY